MALLLRRERSEHGGPADAQGHLRGDGDAASANDPGPERQLTLRVLEYNTQHGGIGTDGKYSPDRSASVVAKINPDIVSLCELESKDSYDSGDAIAQWKSMLEAKTGQTWYSLDIQDYGDWTAGGIRNAIFSKYPVHATYRHEFSTGRDRTVGGVSITVNGRNINFMSTHFDPYDQSNRISEAKQLVSYANGFAEDRIILGDFNALPGTTEMNTIGAAYHDAWVDARSSGRISPLRTTRTAIRAERASTSCGIRKAKAT